MNVMARQFSLLATRTTCLADGPVADTAHKPSSSRPSCKRCPGLPPGRCRPRPGQRHRKKKNKNDEVADVVIP